MDAVARNSSEDVLRTIDRLLVEGQSAQHFARQMLRFLRNALVAKVAGSDSQVLQISTDERARVARVADRFSEEDLSRFMQIMLRTHSELGYKQEQRFHPGTRTAEAGARATTAAAGRVAERRGKRWRRRAARDRRVRDPQAAALGCRLGQLRDRRCPRDRLRGRNQRLRASPQHRRSPGHLLSRRTAAARASPKRRPNRTSWPQVLRRSRQRLLTVSFASGNSSAESQTAADGSTATAVAVASETVPEQAKPRDFSGAGAQRGVGGVGRCWTADAGAQPGRGRVVSARASKSR